MFNKAQVDEQVWILRVDTVPEVRRNGEIRYPDEVLALEKLADCETIELEAAGFPFKVYRYSAKKPTADAPLFINIHGGGWFVGHEANDGCFSAWIADRIGGTVLDVDYTTSEFCDLTVMVEQCKAAADYAFEHCEEFGCSLERVSIGGYSAGGHLTACVVESFLEEKKKAFALQILCYSPLDLRRKPASKSVGKEEERMAKRGAAFDALCFRGEDHLRNDAHYSPALADDLLLSASPRTLIITAGRCGFRFEDEAYGARLVALGVEVTMRRFPDAFHGFIPHFFPEWEDAGQLMVRHILTARS